MPLRLRLRLRRHRRRATARPGAAGQGLVELALVLPLFLGILIGAIDLGRVVWANDTLNSAAREAARYAVVHGGSPSNPCPVGPAGPDATVPLASETCPYPSPSKQAVREVVIESAIAGGTDITVQVCYGTGCSGDTDIPGATNARGTQVTVTVSSPISLVIPSLLGTSSVTVTATSSMLVNH